MNLLKSTKSIGLVLSFFINAFAFAETQYDETINYFIYDTLYLNSSGEVDYLPSNYLADFQLQNQSLTEIISSSEVDDECTGLGSQVVDFVVTDGTLLLDASLTLTILDTISPVAVLNSNINLSLDENGTVELTWAALNLNSYDNCSFETIITPSSFTCTDLGQKMVYLTQTDLAGNVTLDSSLVNIVDNSAPIIQVNQVVAYIDSFGNATISVNQFDNGSSDNCDENFDFTLSDSIFGIDDLGLNTVIFTVTNGHSETTSLNTQVEVKDTMAPFIVSQNLVMHLNEEGEVSISPSAYDDGTVDNSLIYNLSTDKTHFTCEDLGTNEVVLTATDNYNNISTKIVEVDIQDNIAPVAVAQNVTLVLDEAGNAVLLPESLDNGSTDNCTVHLAVSESIFDCTDIGSHNVFLTVTDDGDNSNSDAAIVTIVDNSSPNAQVQPLTLYLNANGIVSLDPEDLDDGSSDNCSEIVEFTASQTLFNCEDIGANIIQFGIEDEYDNTSSINVSVTIEDNLPPVVILQDIVASLDTNGEFIISEAVVDGGSYDNCSGSLSFTFSDTLLTNLDLGDNIITVIVSDSNGNSSDGDDVTITVNDDNPPVLVSPLNDLIVYSESNICGKFVFFETPIFTDNSGDFTVSFSQGSGSFFDLGETEIIYSATDGSANMISDTFMVIVLDNTPPEVLNSIANYTFDSLGVVTWDESQLVFSDNCSSTLDYSLSHNSLDTFPIGDTHVSGTVTDESNNTTAFTFLITVDDIVDPVFVSVPNDFNVYLEGTASCEQAITYSPAEATDNYSSVAITYSIESGSLLGVGLHDIVITATDSSGNYVEETIQVEIIDTISPEFVSFPSDITVGFCDNVVSYNPPEASDNCDVHSLVRVSGLPSGSNFSIGQHTIVYRITDVNGNITDSSFVVEVVTETPPNISTVKVGCTENEPIILAEDIENIVFNGLGIDGHEFDPAIAGEGIHNVDWTWTDSHNCEHEGSMEVIINSTPPMPIIIQTDILDLSVHNAYNTYQWYRNGVAIEGATNISYHFTMGGNYEVIVGNESNCYVLSEIFKIGIGTYPSLSIDEFEKEQLILFPNPARDEVLITSFIELDNISVYILNLLGQKEEISNFEKLNSNQIRINISELQTGIYTLNVQTDNGLMSKKMIVK